MARLTVLYKVTEFVEPGESYGRFNGIEVGWFFEQALLGCELDGVDGPGVLLHLEFPCTIAFQEVWAENHEIRFGECFARCVFVADGVFDFFAPEA